MELLRLLLLWLLLPYRVPISRLSLAERSSFAATFATLSADLTVILSSSVSSSALSLLPPITYYQQHVFLPGYIALLRIRA